MNFAKGALSTLFSQGANAVFSIVVLVATSRIITPESFGVLAIYMGLFAISVSLSNLGLDSIFISRGITDDNKLIAAVSSIAVVGALFMILSLMTCGILDYYQLYQNVLNIFWLVGPAVFVHNLVEGKRIIHSVNRRYYYISKGVFYSGLLKSILTLVFAFVFDMEEYSFVVSGVLVSIFLYCYYSSYCICGGAYSSFSLGCFKVVWIEIREGLLVSINRGFAGFVHSMDKLIFPALYGLSFAGGYNRMQQVAAIPDANIRNPLTNVVLSFSERSDSPSKFFRGFLAVVNILCILPCAVLLFHSDLIVETLLGESWIDFYDVAMFLAIWGTGRVFFGLGLVFHLSSYKIFRWSKIVVSAVFFYGFLFVLGWWFSLQFIDMVALFSFASAAYWLFFGVSYCFCSNGRFTVSSFHEFIRYLFEIFLIFTSIFVAKILFYDDVFWQLSGLFLIFFLAVCFYKKEVKYLLSVR